MSLSVSAVCSPKCKVTHALVISDQKLWDCCRGITKWVHTTLDFLFDKAGLGFNMSRDKQLWNMTLGVYACMFKVLECLIKKMFLHFLLPAMKVFRTANHT